MFNAIIMFVNFVAAAGAIPCLKYFGRKPLLLMTFLILALSNFALAFLSLD
jgi:hypothetical protein